MPFRDRHRRFSVFWSGGKDIFNPVLEMVTQEREFLLRDQDREFLGGVLEMVRAEIRVEEALETLKETLLGELSCSGASDDFQSIHRRFREEVCRYFLARRSPSAFQTLCGTFRDALLACCADVSDTPGVAVLSLGRGGRNELNPWDAQSVIVIHPRGYDAGAIRGRLEGAGGIFRPPAGFPPSTDIDGWRDSVIPALLSEDGPVGADAAADLRFVTGDPETGRVAVDTVFDRYRSKPHLLRAAGRGAAVVPVGTGLLGIFRVEKRGEHRGELNVVSRGLAPLVACVRIFAVNHGIRVTGTRERIRHLLEMGRLDVTLAEELTRAYDAFARMEIQVEFEAREKDHSFVDPGRMADEDSTDLRQGFEAVETLQKIMYAWAGQ